MLQSAAAFGFAFGPTNVGLYRMALALEAGDPDQTLSIAEGMHPEQHPPSSRRAAFGWTAAVR